MGENRLKVNGNDIGASGRGTNILEIDRSGNKVNTANFDTYDVPDTATPNMIDFIDNAETGNILLFAVNGHAANMNYSGVDRIEKLGSKYIRDAIDENDRNSWTFITVKGGLVLDESYKTNANGPTSVTVTLPDSFSIQDSGSLETEANEIGPAPESLIGWWPLDGHTRDLSENRNGGTNNGATVTSGLGQSAYDFDGSSNIDSQNIRAVDIPKITVAFWCNPNTGGWALGNGKQFRVKVSNPIEWWVREQNSGSSNRLTGGTPSSEWNFVCCSYDGTVQKIHLNGVKVGSTTPNLEVLDGGDNGFTIGESYAGSGFHFDGKIQDVRLYDRALSESEVAQLYALTDPREDQQLIQTQDGQALVSSQFSDQL